MLFFRLRSAKINGPKKPPEQAISKTWDEEFKERNKIGTNLQGQDFSNQDLSYYIFTRCNLENANFAGAKLHKAQLRNADLRGANFEGADLVKSDLTRSDLSGANFANANLEHSILEYTNLRHTNFRGAKLKGSHVYGVQGIARDMANFEGSTISEASFEEQLTHTDYGGSLLDPENRVKSRHRGQDSSIERRAREDWRKKNITDR